MNIEDAVKEAMDECIAEGVLADFLRKNRAEVQRMSVLEYNEELHLKNVRQDGYDEAKAESDRIIAEKDAIIAKKDAEINAIVSEKNAEIDAIISEKNAEIARLNALLKQEQ